jgi:hypothetical protein
MADRTTQQTVTFLHPFSLAAADDLIRAGTYTIETVEEEIGSATAVGYRRISTTMTIPSETYGAGARQVIEINPADLELALKRDRDFQVLEPSTGAKPAVGRAPD